MKTVNCLARQLQDGALASRLARRARFAIFFPFCLHPASIFLS